MMYWASGTVVALLLFLSPIMGYLSQPWAPWWIGQRTNAPIVLGGGARGDGSIPDVPIVQTGGVTDAQRFALARGAGFTAQESVTATAISIAEDGSGNPAALSGVNFNGTRDLGLWQINSAHWAEFGGQLALVVPKTNAHAAYVIYQRQGACAWSTFEEACGPGHNGSYRLFLARAARAAQP